ncbi:MAG TPA: acyl-CoA dehydrogenase family protein, partial [Aggregatilineales bacterium]|nr:acyl-CoA dehydrogenase family protein [Aggregatilineales bacterium]
YVQERRTFGSLLADHDGVKLKLADMATRLEAARQMTYYAAWCKDQGRGYTKEAAMAKLFASEASEFVAREAVQLHGGYGYSTEFAVERIYRDQRLMSIGEGANDVLRLVIGSRVASG